MKKTLLLLLSTLFISYGSIAQEKLTNQDVLDMIEMGFEQAVIIAKIQNTPTNFDVSIETLKNLKEKGVSNQLLSAMVKASGVNLAAQPVKTGLFMVTDSSEMQILPTVFSASRTNTLAATFSYGIASAKTKSALQNVTSSNIIPQGTCSFVFYFKPSEGESFGSNWWFRKSTSPAEFALVKMDVNTRRNCRELEVGSINMWAGVETGVKNKFIYEVTIQDKGNGVFVVTPKEPLEKGEYCFYYKGTVPQGGYNNQSAFDFSITQ